MRSQCFSTFLSLAKSLVSKLLEAKRYLIKLVCQIWLLYISPFLQTGNPKNYGFIEFQFEDVAKIAADTMNNYLMFDHIIKCTLLPEEKIPKNLFQNWNRPFVSTVKTHKVIHNRSKTDSKEYKLMVSRLKRVHTMEKKLAEKGITFKCVIANRPTGLSKPIKADTKSNQTVSKVVSKPSKTMKEIVLKSTPIARRPVTRRNVASSFKVEPLWINKYCLINAS